jgi:hypothetical protein
MLGCLASLALGVRHHNFQGVTDMSELMRTEVNTGNHNFIIVVDWSNIDEETKKWCVLRQASTDFKNRMRINASDGEEAIAKKQQLLNDHLEDMRSNGETLFVPEKRQRARLSSKERLERINTSGFTPAQLKAYNDLQALFS